MDRESWSKLQSRARRLENERPSSITHLLAGKLMALWAGTALAITLALAPGVFEQPADLRSLLRSGGQPSPTAIARPAATPTPSIVSVTPERQKIGNTGGEGVYLRRTPRLEDRLRHLSDDTPIFLLGRETRAGGVHWIYIRDALGNEGLVACCVRHPAVKLDHGHLPRPLLASPATSHRAPLDMGCHRHRGSTGS